jgi:6-phosphogluconolactonase (cycloisomerase 2 family)
MSRAIGLVAAALAAACGGAGPTSPEDHEIGPRRVSYAYVINTYGGMSGFRIDPTSGRLTALPESPFRVGRATVTPLADPLGDFLYITDRGNAAYGLDVYGYRVARDTGALEALAGSPWSFERASAADALIDPRGRFIFLSASARIHVVAIDRTTGALSPVPGSPFATGSMPPLRAVDATGRYLYAVNPVDFNPPRRSGDDYPPQNFEQRLWGYAISPRGALSVLPGAPFVLGHNRHAVLSPFARFAWAISDAGSIDTFTFDPATGAPKALPDAGGEALLAATLHPPVQLAAASDERFLFALDQDRGQIAGFALDHATGRLTRVPDAPASLPSYADSITVDPAGRFVYAADGHLYGQIHWFAIDRRTGALAARPDGSAAGDHGPTAIAVVAPR